MRALDTGVQWIARWLARAGLCLLIAFASFTLVDGLSRGLFHAPIDAVRDLGDVVVAVAISCCFPQAFLERRNIVISVIDGLAGARAARAIDLGAAFVVAGMTLLFAWQFALYAGQLGAAGETTAMLQLPKQPFWIVVDANLWLTLAAQLAVLLRSLRGRMQWVR